MGDGDSSSAPGPRQVIIAALLLPLVQAAPRVLCIGETLFDGLPSGIFLGGAPLNVACHLAEQSVAARYASAVGRDRLGIEARRRLESRDVDTSLIATVGPAETGFVTVDIDEHGDASYDFTTPAAWDFVPVDGLRAAAEEADALVFGTLSQRASGTRAAVAAARDAAHYVVCDINLRPPFTDDEVVASSAVGVDLLKLNDDELLPVALALERQCGALQVTPEQAAAAVAAAISAAEAEAEAEAGAASEDAATTAIVAAAAALGHAASSGTVVVTRGSQGAVLWESAADGSDEGCVCVCGGFRAPAIADTVGAGDSFLAALLAHRLRGAPPAQALEAGCRLGAYVASQPGATPRHDEAAIGALQARVVGLGPVVQSEVKSGAPPQRA